MESETALHQGLVRVRGLDWIHRPTLHLIGALHHSLALLSLVDAPLAGHVLAHLAGIGHAVDLLAMDTRVAAVHDELGHHPQALQCLIAGVILAHEITPSHPNVLECLV